VIGPETALRPALDRVIWRRIARETTHYALAAAVGLIYLPLAVVLMSYVASGHETGIENGLYAER
jgi:hypothetical protein